MSTDLIPAHNELIPHTQSLSGLAMQLGYEGTLSVGALEDEIRFYQQRSVEAVLELGKRLLILKEITPHGEFTKRIEMLGISKRTAQRFMSVVLKFSKTTTLSLLEKSGNGSKLLELMVLDDDDIDVIEQGGSIGDINLDTIETMSVRELKKALREAKADNDAKDQLVQKKDQKINELDAKVTKLESPAQIKKRAETEQQQLAKTALEQASVACLTMHNDVVRFTNHINSILESINENGLFEIQEQLEASVVAAFQQIAQSSVELGIQIDFEAMVNPAWMATAEKSPLTGGDLEGAFADTTTELES